MVQNSTKWQNNSWEKLNEYPIYDINNRQQTYTHESFYDFPEQEGKIKYELKKN